VSAAGKRIGAAEPELLDAPQVFAAVPDEIALRWGFGLGLFFGSAHAGEYMSRPRRHASRNLELETWNVEPGTWNSKRAPSGARIPAVALR
jgi:hypothetical protein